MTDVCLMIFFIIFFLESQFDSSGRPLEPAFFTGSPAYHNLVYSIYQQQALLEEEKEEEEKEEAKVGGEKEGEDRSTAGKSTTAEAPKIWIKKDAMSNVIAEELTDSQV